jgi:hypothetical protein
LRNAALISVPWMPCSMSCTKRSAMSSALRVTSGVGRCS